MIIEVIEHKHVDKYLFEGFERYQETKQIYYLEGKKLTIKDEYYVEQWDANAIDNVVNILNYYLDNNGAVITVRNNDNKLIGFAGLNGIKFGSKKQYLNLGFIHVTYNLRGHGIGKLLFEQINNIAKDKGALKLYIGANPAIDTYKFYQSVGCTLATEIIPEVYNHEPLDLQLEYIL